MALFPLKIIEISEFYHSGQRLQGKCSDSDKAWG